MDEPKIQEGESEVTKKAIQLLNLKGISFEKLEHAPVTTITPIAMEWERPTGHKPEC